jgi:glucokinase
MKYIVAIDIGGTTFNSGIFSESMNQVASSDKDKIRNHGDKESVINAIIEQVNNLIVESNIERSDIIGVGIGAPGPLDAKKGVILKTPNLTIFQDYKIASDFTKRLKLDTFIENDANLFALGEWHSQYKENKVTVGVTLGTGLGFGLVINGVLFVGGHGMAMEYGLSPFEWGMCEKNVSINFIRKRASELYGEELSPVIIEQYCKDGDKKAIQIYSEYGHNLGIVLSHVINMIDPQVISIGGGLSNAFNCFKESMFSVIEKHAPSFNSNHTIIAQSKLRENSTMIGACMMVKTKKNA